jgi:hypothetical protein
MNSRLAAGPSLQPKDFGLKIVETNHLIHGIDQLPTLLALCQRRAIAQNNNLWSLEIRFLAILQVEKPILT